ncbi:hypothetical protein CCR91_13360 [Thiorhodovibrio winogradskyi]|nr:hypothetical protein [Thiorhodovibrio winogradskyi]
MEIGGDPQPVTDNYNLGYQDGYAAGVPVGREQCRQNPSSCSINLTNVLPPAQYGETEPNDTLISADPLTTSVNFWAQSYGWEDQDWYYLVTPDQNYNLTVNFSLPEANTNLMTGWNVSIRNAVGMVLTEFNTDFTTVESARAGISYRATVGLAGAYYIVVKPVLDQFNYQPYNLAVAMEPSPFDGPAFAGGYYDAETEPNNEWNAADNITNGVSMYGLVNLEFSGVVAGDPDYTWGQGEADWYVYESPGNEIVQLSFCDRQFCSNGNWLVQFFDQARAMDPQAFAGNIVSGADPYDAAALVSFNTTNCGLEPCDSASVCPTTCDARTDPEVWNLGIQQSGTYYIRVNHKRLIAAPCAGYQIDSNNDGLPDGGACGCDTGYSCDIDILNPGTPTTTAEGEPDYPFCPDGSGGGTSAQCTAGCICTAYGGVVAIPEDFYTSQYNFTWITNPFGSPLPFNPGQTN